MRFFRPFPSIFIAIYPVRAEKDMTCMMELLVVARYIKIKINKAQLINPTRPEKNAEKFLLIMLQN